jgi:hypothetical protein
MSGKGQSDPLPADIPTAVVCCSDHSTPHREPRGREQSGIVEIDTSGQAAPITAFPLTIDAQQVMN